ncbi:WG repeat-containing protein [Paenibacillus sp. y28]|uniref:WG repeat-containing protein n=1 Tax=Paenibacillus sp. y28 TaxID=3129110 RepID=UPI003019FA90
MKKRFLSLALSLFLVISLFPQAALAVDYIEVVPPQYDYADDFHEGLARVAAGDKYGFIDKMGKEVIPLKYDYAGNFREGLAWVAVGKSIIDRKYGFVDKTGKEVIPLQYDGAESFSEGVAIVQSYPTYGVIDKTGNVVVPFGKYGMASNYFSDGIACFYLTIKEPWENGCIDKTGEVVVPFGMYSDVGYFKEGLARTLKNGLGYIDKTGKAITPFKYEFTTEFSEGMSTVRYPDFNWGFIDKTGKEVVPSKYDYVESFSEGTAVVSIGGKTNGSKWGTIDKTGNEIIPLGKYDVMQPFSEGLAAVGVGGEWTAANSPVYEGGQWGYIDKTGREVIPPQYGVPSKDNQPSKFSEGMAVIEVNGSSALIDKTGREVVPPVYDDIGDVHEGMAYVRNGYHMYGFISVPGATLYVYEDPAPTATPTTSNVLVNGEETVFDAYTINGHNYVKLRDAARAVSGSVKQFEVTWDGNKNAINLVSGKPYTPTGGEWVKGDGTAQVAAQSTAMVYKDGVAVTRIAYTINGNNYFKLRDLGQAFDFNVSWDGEKNAVIIDTTAGYTADS